VLSLLLLLQLLHGFAQNWTVGGYAVFTNTYRSVPLEIKSFGRTSLRDLDFVSKVGGVAFDAVATPAEDLHFSRISLEYRASYPDGQRLGINVDNNQYGVNLPDWELIPIAMYANSEYTACVSLFGQEGTNDVPQITYHPAFVNRLLGMRLLHADLMFENIERLDDIRKVLKYDSRYVLGSGESMPDEAASSAAASSIAGIFYKSVENGGGFNSYVLTDAGVPVRFSMKQNGFTITGRPYYYFFKYPSSRDGNPQPSTALTSAIRLRSSEVRNLNPLVYDAAARTMRFAAFFRYVRENYPAEWQSFIASIINVRTMPAVLTPTSMIK
jgi:hypothetical protein